MKSRRGSPAAPLVPIPPEGTGATVAPGAAQSSVERRNQLSATGSGAPRNSLYSNGPATTGPASAKAPGAVVPLVASTTRMPLPVVIAPGPPALVMRNNELPLAVPPLMTSLSDGEPSAPKKVFIAIVPPAPDVVGRRQEGARRSARAHVHQAGIGDAGYGLTEAIEIERSAARDRHWRIWAERIRHACAQRARVDVRRAAVGVGSGERGGAGEHIHRTVAADRRRKHVVGGRVIEVDRTGAGAKCDARRSERAGCSRRTARARADVECSNRSRRSSRSQQWPR